VPDEEVLEPFFPSIPDGPIGPAGPFNEIVNGQRLFFFGP
jgi:hypothetical protein